MLESVTNHLMHIVHTYLCSHQLHEGTWVLPLGGGQSSLQQTHFPDKTCVVRERESVCESVRERERNVCVCV